MRRKILLFSPLILLVINSAYRFFFTNYFYFTQSRIHLLAYFCVTRPLKFFCAACIATILLMFVFQITIIEKGCKKLLVAFLIVLAAYFLFIAFLLLNKSILFFAKISDGLEIPSFIFGELTGILLVKLYQSGGNSK